MGLFLREVRKGGRGEQGRNEKGGEWTYFSGEEERRRGGGTAPNLITELRPHVCRLCMHTCCLVEVTID